jgi:phospholipid/cholesterol/gamma-HCH transport system substrate-binding protein
MAIQNKASWARLKVGLMAMAALAILAVLIFLLTGNSNPFISKVIIYTYLEDSAAMTENSAVRLNGIQIGKVKKIGLSNLKDPGKIIRMDLEIQDKYLSSIPVDSVVAIGAENLLGTKFLNIKKGLSKETIRPGATLEAKNLSDFNEVIAQGNELLSQLQSVLKRVDAIVGIVEQGKGSIGKLLVDEELYNRVLAVVAEVQKLSSALNSNKGTIGKLVYDDAIYNDVRGSIARVDALLDNLQQGQGTMGRLLKDPAMYDDAHKTILDLRKILADIDAGKGTVGKLLKSDQLHNEISTTIGKIDLMIDKVNSGQGTIGQLLVNPSLYDSLNGATREAHELIKDFRANPKKFLRIKLGLF